MSALIDISPTISARLAVWPGDVGFTREVALRLEDGDPVALSCFRTTCHVGAHTDAPSHTLEGGDTVERRPLDAYYGPCQVVAVEVEAGARILPSDLPGPIEAPRVLLRTGTFPDPERFAEGFASLSPELIEHLAAAGCVLVGLDTPSVDPFSDKTLASHQAIWRAGMANLEGLVLDGVAPGLYTLLALPLKLEGADAAPVRAALAPHAPLGAA